MKISTISKTIIRVAGWDDKRFFGFLELEDRTSVFCHGSKISYYVTGESLTEKGERIPTEVSPSIIGKHAVLGAGKNDKPAIDGVFGSPLLEFSATEEEIESLRQKAKRLASVTKEEADFVRALLSMELTANVVDHSKWYRLGRDLRLSMNEAKAGRIVSVGQALEKNKASN